MTGGTLRYARPVWATGWPDGLPHRRGDFHRAKPPSILVDGWSCSTSVSMADRKPGAISTVTSGPISRQSKYRDGYLAGNLKLKDLSLWLLVALIATILLHWMIA